MTVYKPQPCSSVLGIKFWAQHYIGPVAPQYQVFKVFGYNPNNGHYFFSSWRNPQVVMVKSYYQLGTAGFMPFLIPGGRRAHL